MSHRLCRFLVAAIASMAMLPAAHGAFLRWVPSTRDTTLGQVTYIDLQFEQSIGSLVHVAAFDLEFSFDTNLFLLRKDLSVFGPGGTLLERQLDCPGLPATCTDWGSIAQMIDLFEGIEMLQVSFAPADEFVHQAASFYLVRLAFDGNASEGTTALTIERAELVDEFGQLVTLEGPLPQAQISLVLDQPGTPALAVAAVGALAFARRRPRSPR